MSGGRAASKASHEQGAAHGTAVLPAQGTWGTVTVYLLLDHHSAPYDKKMDMTAAKNGNTFWSLQRDNSPYPLREDLWWKETSPFVKRFMLEHRLFSPGVDGDFLWMLYISLPNFSRHRQHDYDDLCTSRIGRGGDGRFEFNVPHNLYLLMQQQQKTAWVYDKVKDSIVPPESISKVIGYDSKLLKIIEGDISELKAADMLEHMLTKEYMHEQYLQIEQELRSWNCKNREILETKRALIQEIIIRAFLQTYTKLFTEHVHDVDTLKSLRPIVPEWLFQTMADILHINICVVNEDNASVIRYMSMGTSERQDIGQKIDFSSFFWSTPSSEIILMKLDNIYFVNSKSTKDMKLKPSKSKTSMKWVPDDWMPKSMSQHMAKNWLKSHTADKLRFTRHDSRFLIALEKSVFGVMHLTYQGETYLKMLQRHSPYSYPDGDSDLLRVIMEYVRTEDKWEEIYDKIGPPMSQHKKTRHTEQHSADKTKLPDRYIWDTISCMSGEKRVRLDGTEGYFDGMDDIVKAGILTRADLAAYRDFPSMKDLEEELPRDKMDMTDLANALPGRKRARSTSPMPEIAEWREDYLKTDLHTKFHKAYSDAVRGIDSESTSDVERRRLNYVKSLIPEILVRADLWSLRSGFWNDDTMKAPTWILDIVVKMTNVPLVLLDCTDPQSCKNLRYKPPRDVRHSTAKPLDAEVQAFEPARKSTHMNPGAQEFRPSTKLVSSSVALTLPTNSELALRSSVNVFLTGVPTGVVAGVNAGSGRSRRKSKSVRRAAKQEDLDHYRVLLEHAVDDDSDEDEETQVILVKLNNRSFLGTVSPDLLYIPDFDPSKIKIKMVSEDLLKKAVSTVAEYDHKLIPREYNFWGAYLCSRKGLMDLDAEMVDGSSSIKIDYVREKIQKLHDFIRDGRMYDWVWSKIRHPEGAWKSTMTGIPDQFVRQTLQQSTLTDFPEIQLLLQGIEDSPIQREQCRLHFELFRRYNLPHLHMQDEIKEVVIEAAFLQITPPDTGAKSDAIFVDIQNWVIQALANMDRVTIDIVAMEDENKDWMKETFEEKHVILVELNNLSFYGTVSSELSRILDSSIPDFDPSKMKPTRMSRDLWQKAVSKVAEYDHKLIPRVYNFWGSYLHSRNGLIDLDAKMDSGSSSIKIDYVREKIQKLHDFIRDGRMYDWVWSKIRHPAGEFSPTMLGIPDKFVRPALKKNKLLMGYKEIQKLLETRLESYLLGEQCYLHFELFRRYKSKASSQIQDEIKEVVIEAAFLQITPPHTGAKSDMIFVDIQNWAIQALANMDRVTIDIVAMDDKNKDWITEKFEPELDDKNEDLRKETLKPEPQEKGFVNTVKETFEPETQKKVFVHPPAQWEKEKFPRRKSGERRVVPKDLTLIQEQVGLGFVLKRMSWEDFMWLALVTPQEPDETLQQWNLRLLKLALNLAGTTWKEGMWPKNPPTHNTLLCLFRTMLHRSSYQSIRFNRQLDPRGLYCGYIIKTALSVWRAVVDMFCECLQRKTPSVWGVTWPETSKPEQRDLRQVEITFKFKDETIRVTNEDWSKMVRKLYSSNVNYFVTQFQLSVLSYVKTFASFSSFEFWFDEDLVFKTLAYLAKHKRKAAMGGESTEQTEVAGLIDNTAMGLSTDRGMPVFVTNAPGEGLQGILKRRNPYKKKMPGSKFPKNAEEIEEIEELGKRKNSTEEETVNKRVRAKEPGDDDEESNGGEEDEEASGGEEDEEASGGEEDEEASGGEEDEEASGGEEDDESGASTREKSDQHSEKSDQYSEKDVKEDGDTRPKIPAMLDPKSDKFWPSLRRFCNHMNLCAEVLGSKKVYMMKSRLVQHEYRTRGLCSFWRIIRAYSVEPEDMEEDDVHYQESKRRLGESHVETGYLTGRWDNASQRYEGTTIAAPRRAQAGWRWQRREWMEDGSGWGGYDNRYKFLVPGSAMSTPGLAAIADGCAGSGGAGLRPGAAAAGGPAGVNTRENTRENEYLVGRRGGL
jgi:hypothetical protein